MNFKTLCFFFTATALAGTSATAAPALAVLDVAHPAGIAAAPIANRGARPDFLGITFPLPWFGGGTTTTTISAVATPTKVVVHLPKTIHTSPKKTGVPTTPPKKAAPPPPKKVAPSPKKATPATPPKKTVVPIPPPKKAAPALPPKKAVVPTPSYTIPLPPNRRGTPRNPRYTHWHLLKTWR
ncbi:hypothetical protein BGX27_000599 [Mortierella sp. AM989]|nr:hypothetical protein BGX27_000599 [Mortierella sp. AM989]